MPWRRRRRFSSVERTEADGVPIFWAEAPAPFVAAIVFRVGRADESLTTAGITHLVEHLAMPTTEVSGVDMNGVVTATETMFWASGSRERALKAFASILGGLADLPLERLETERGILRTEAASSSGEPVLGAAALRFGPRGYGLGAYDELGLNRIGGAEVEDWWRERFTGGNAAVWMSGRPPGKFEVPLLRGEQKPLPPVTPIAGVPLPAHNVGGPSGGLSASLLVERSSAANAVIAIAGTRARRQLRFEHGLSYGAYSIYEPLTADRAHAVLIADCLDDKAPTVRDGLMTILRELADDGPSEDELRDNAEGLEAAASEPSELTGFLHGQASDELIGRPIDSPAQLVELRAEVTRESAARALAEAMPTLLLTTPDGSGDVRPGLERYPLWSPRRVSGRTHRLRGLYGRRELRKARAVSGPEGVSLVAPDGQALTVFFADCVALAHWPDGTRGLWGEDGFYIEVDPSHWRGGKELARLIDESVAPELRVPMEPSFEDRAASVEGAAENIKRGWMTSDELAALPHVLAEDERVVSVVQASRRLKVGVAALTDRRFLFLYFDDVLVDVPCAAITDVRSEGGSLLKDNSLSISTASETHEFSDLRPKERLAELVAAIEAARTG
jgi:zinc protease